eukprot:6248829-Prorocentrum_lima.AAC.1
MSWGWARAAGAAGIGGGGDAAAAYGPIGKGPDHMQGSWFAVLREGLGRRATWRVKPVRVRARHRFLSRCRNKGVS